MAVQNKHQTNKDHDRKAIEQKPTESRNPNAAANSRLTRARRDVVEAPAAPPAIKAKRALREAPDDRVLMPRSARPLLPVSRRGCWGNCALFGGLSLLVLVLVFSFLVLLTAFEVFDFMRDPFDNFLTVFGFEDSEPEVVNTQVIVLGIRDMSFLVTATGEVEIEKSVVKRLTAAPDASLTIRYFGSANVGIDLSRVGDADVIMNPDGSVAVYLPPVQIMDCALRTPNVISSSCTELALWHDCDGAIEDMRREAYERSLDDLRTLAETDELVTPNGEGIMTLAYENAEKAVYELMQKLGYDRVTFVRSEVVLPAGPSCYTGEVPTPAPPAAQSVDGAAN